MKLNQQIKIYRTKLNMSQEELANKIFVTRQTVSNWETNKNYPDIHSLLLMSSLFKISLDQLVKGDLEIMKETIQTENIKQFNILSTCFSVMLILLIISFAPLYFYLGWHGLIISGLLSVATLIISLKVEKHKKEYDIQTYKEIVAFMEGKRLDEITKNQEIGKRNYQKIICACSLGLLTFILTIALLSLFSSL